MILAWKTAAWADWQLFEQRLFSRQNQRLEGSQAARSAWSHLSKKVYAVDPLICLHRGGEKRYVAVIEEAPEIEWILRDLGAWDFKSRTASAEAPRPGGTDP